MEQIVLNVKDKGKLSFLLELLKQLDFVEVQDPSLQESALSTNEQYDFFASAGMWKDKDIDAKILREKAWRNNR